ncbi:MAG: hypothetical protein ACFB0G_17040 [Leptolyngbyaceae cyanobacterium]
MLSNLFSSIVPEDALLSIVPDSDFFDTTSVLELVSTVSEEAEAFLLDGLETLETAVGEISINAGVFDGILTTATDTFSAIFDGPEFLTEAIEFLADTTGTLSLVDGIVNATLQVENELFEVIDFDLATFAADGFSVLLSSVDTALPIENGALLIDVETELGPISGIIDVANGALDVDLDTPIGALDFTTDFGPEAVYTFEVPTALGSIDATLNLDTGNLEVPLFIGSPIIVPLSSLSGDLTLDDGTATLAIDSQFGPISTSFEVDELVSNLVIDTLTGLSIDAALTPDGLLDVLATSGTEIFETTVDLADLGAQAVSLLEQTSGDIRLNEGLISGILSVGEDSFEIAETVADLATLLTNPIGDLFTLPATAV